MKKNDRARFWLLCISIVLVAFSGVAFAADCPSDIKAVTTADSAVPVDVLEYRVMPLTKCELEAEAQAWLELLKQKVTEISSAEVAALYKKQEIKKTKQVESAIEEAQQAKVGTDIEDAADAEQEAKQVQQEAKELEKKSAQDASVREAIKAAETRVKEEAGSDEKPADATAQKEGLKKALVQHITGLTAERTALTDRLNVVLKSLKAKGGETDEYDNYIKAVSGIKVDVTDASATWTTMTGWLMSPEGGFRWAVNVIQFVLIIVVFYVLSLVSRKASQRGLAKSKLSALLREFLIMSASRLVLIIGFFVGLSALEINVGPVLAIIGAAGFVIAFALQNSLSNFASGILMLFYRPFDTGDFIKVAGVVGKVETMNLLSTQMRTPDNQLMIVPNNSVWGDVITNITGITERRVDLMFGIGYGDDIDKAHKILEEIVNGHELVMKEPEPVVKLHELGDSSVNFICRPWVRPENYWAVYWDITREVKRRFDAEGVSIPFPQRDVHIYHESREEGGAS